jgi:hypothetical protein
MEWDGTNTEFLLNRPSVMSSDRWCNIGQRFWHPVRCDRHGHELAGESPAIALKRREYVGEGKGA